jgi:hypothetical protein
LFRRYYSFQRDSLLGQQSGRQPELLQEGKEIRDSPVVADFAVANAHVYCLEVDFPSSRCQSRNIPLYFWNNEDLV